MKRIRLAGLAFMTVVAMGGVAAASASAMSFEFKAETYPVEVRGVASSIQRFEFGGLVTACRKAAFNSNEEGASNPTKESSILVVHPIYAECENPIGGGVFKAQVNSTGCDFRLHAVAPNEKTGSFDIECAASRAIEVEPLGISGCRIEIPSQTGLKEIEYVNEALPPKRVRVNAEVENLAYKASPECGLSVKVGTGGSSYRGSALLNGFKPATTEADGLEVHPSHPH